MPVPESLYAAAEIEADTAVKAIGVAADITNTGSLQSVIRLLGEQAAFKTINIVVHNAAGPITSMDGQIAWPDKEWLAAIDVKTVGALPIVREFLPLLAQDGTGASGIAVWGPALLHGLNNAAVIYMTRFLAADLAPSQITVNAIIPGLVGTEYRQTWAKQLGEQQGKSGDQAIEELCKAKAILLGRWAESSEMGDWRFSWRPTVRPTSLAPRFQSMAGSARTLDKQHTH